MPVSEEQIAKTLTDCLSADGWEIYQEVQITPFGKCADIVAVLGALTWVIEVKTTLSIKVMEQAYRWTGDANMVSVAVPRSRSRGQFAEIVLKRFGIGLVEIYDHGYNRMVFPDFNRTKTNLLKDALKIEHKTFAKAGNAEKRRFTPFAGTRRDIVAYVKKNDRCTIGELLDDVETHYHTKSTARSCVVNYVKSGVIDELGIEKDDKGMYRLFCKGERA